MKAISDTATPRNLPLPLGERVGVRGLSLPRRGQDRLQDAFHILDHLVVPEPQYPIAALFKKPRSLGICRSLIAMLAAIELYDQPNALAQEVDDIRTDWNLTPEFQATQTPIAQPKPELRFDRCRIASKLARAVAVFGRLFDHWREHPHPNPLPQGRGNERIAALYPLQAVGGIHA